MTYEEYKNNKEGSNKKSFIRSAFSKLFTIIVFVLIVMIISNLSPDFRKFVSDNLLNKTIDFSIINKFTNKITDVFKSEIETPVIKTETQQEKYKNGIKYIYSGDVYVKDSGIVTFVGEKEDYGNTVIIQQSNGYYAWFGNIKESVKLYDYVEANTVLGTSEDEYYYVLLKEDKPVNILNES